MIKQDRKASSEAVQALFDAHRELQTAIASLRLHHDEVYEELVTLNQASAEVLKAAWELRKRNAA